MYVATRYWFNVGLLKIFRKKAPGRLLTLASFCIDLLLQTCHF